MAEKGCIVFNSELQTDFFLCAAVETHFVIYSLLRLLYSLLTVYQFI